MILLRKPAGEFVLATERRVIHARRHWASQAKYVSQALLALAGLFFFSWLVSSIDNTYLDLVIFLSELTVIGWLAVHLLGWWMDVLIVTDKRLMNISGIISEQLDAMPVTRVTDLTWRRSIMGRLLGYGTIRIESAGQHQALEYLDYLPDPDVFHEALSKLVFGDLGVQRSNTLPRPRDERDHDRRREPIRAASSTEPLSSVEDVDPVWPDDTDDVRHDDRDGDGT